MTKAQASTLCKEKNEKIIDESEGKKKIATPKNDVESIKEKGDAGPIMKNYKFPQCPVALQQALPSMPL